MNTIEIIDQATMNDLKETVGADFVIELIDAYLQETPSLIEGLQRSLAGQDAVAFTRAAHSIKSSSASLGLLAFSAQAKELEMLGKESRLADARPKVDSLCTAFDLVQKRLAEYKNES